MALWADLKVNHESIGRVEIIRTAGGDDLDSMNTYKWSYCPGQYPFEADRVYGVATHRYGDGAAALMAKVLTAAAEAGA